MILYFDKGRNDYDYSLVLTTLINYRQLVINMIVDYKNLEFNRLKF